jgi:hypothetical protein
VGARAEVVPIPEPPPRAHPLARVARDLEQHLQQLGLGHRIVTISQARRPPLIALNLELETTVELGGNDPRALAILAFADGDLATYTAALDVLAIHAARLLAMSRESVTGATELAAITRLLERDATAAVRRR